MSVIADFVLACAVGWALGDAIRACNYATIVLLTTAVGVKVAAVLAL
jgi:hypothetical protein